MCSAPVVLYYRLFCLAFERRKDPIHRNLPEDQSQNTEQYTDPYTDPYGTFKVLMKDDEVILLRRET